MSTTVSPTKSQPSGAPWWTHRLTWYLTGLALLGIACFVLRGALIEFVLKSRSVSSLILLFVILVSGLVAGKRLGLVQRHWLPAAALVAAVVVAATVLSPWSGDLRRMEEGMEWPSEWSRDAEPDVFGSRICMDQCLTLTSTFKSSAAPQDLWSATKASLDDRWAIVFEGPQPGEPGSCTDACFLRANWANVELALTYAAPADTATLELRLEVDDRPDDF